MIAIVSSGRPVFLSISICTKGRWSGYARLVTKNHTFVLVFGHSHGWNFYSNRTSVCLKRSDTIFSRGSDWFAFRDAGNKYSRPKYDYLVRIGQTIAINQHTGLQTHLGCKNVPISQQPISSALK